jgi:PmbA protein
MNKVERMELARWAAAQAQKQGAKDAAVDIANYRSVDIQFRDGQLDRLGESTQNSLSIDIYANGRYSNHSTNDLRKDALEKFIREGVAMTKYLGEDPYRLLPDPKYYQGRQAVDLKLLDGSYDAMTSDRRVTLAREVEAAARAASSKIITCTAYWSDGIGHSVKVHTNGFEGENSSTQYDLAAQLTVDDGKGGRPSDWDGQTVRFQGDLPAPAVVAKGAVERTLQQIGQSKMPSGVYDMVVENRAADGLIGALTGPMTGSALHRKSSCFDGLLGQRIASEKLTMIDDPFVISGLGSRLYDDEGMATKRRPLIEKGVLKSYYIGTYYGRKLGIEPTIGGGTNTVFEYGTRSLDQIISGIAKGILVTSFVGGNSNSTTGDISYGVIGMYVEGGKIVKPVNEMNISGNLKELWMQLAEVGNDPYVWSSLRRPSFHFKDVQFSGA